MALRVGKSSLRLANRGQQRLPRTTAGKTTLAARTFEHFWKGFP